MKTTPDIIMIGEMRGMVEVRGNSGHKRGPGAHLLACLRFDGFEALLDRVVLTQGNLDQCLYQLIGRASSGGQRERWLKLVDRLLEAGANPRAKVDCHHLNHTLQQNTFQMRCGRMVRLDGVLGSGCEPTIR